MSIFSVEMFARENSRDVCRFYRKNSNGILNNVEKRVSLDNNIGD